jgi:hypothetical protein
LAIALAHLAFCKERVRFVLDTTERNKTFISRIDIFTMKKLNPAKR